MSTTLFLRGKEISFKEVDLDSFCFFDNMFTSFVLGPSSHIPKRCLKCWNSIHVSNVSEMVFFCMEFLGGSVWNFLKDPSVTLQGIVCCGVIWGCSMLMDQKVSKISFMIELRLIMTIEACNAFGESDQVCISTDKAGDPVSEI